MNDFNDINNLSLFYLGAIAPDTVHTREKQVAEDKIKSHLYARDIQGIEIVYDYYCKKNNCKERDFFLGYCIHILTDIYWGETLHSTFIDRYSQDNEPIQDQRWAYYNDTDKLDFEMYKTVDWKDDVWTLFKKAKGINVDDLLTASEVDDWNTRTLNWYNSGQSYHENPIKYIGLDELMDFIDNSSRDILKWIYFFVSNWVYSIGFEEIDINENT